jgi:hypothetical protein
MLARQSDFPPHIVAGMTSQRIEANARLVMPNVVTIVISAAVFTAKIGAAVLRPERLLNQAEAIAIQSAYSIERLSW